MIGYRCKCGEIIASSSMGVPACWGCTKCKTNLATNPRDHHYPAKHEFVTKYDENTGKPYERCKNCYNKKEHLEKLGELWEEEK
jgi:hypothetical protein